MLKGIEIFSIEDVYYFPYWAENAKWIAEGINYAKKQGRPEMAKHETGVKANIMGVHLVVEDKHAGQRTI